jgi:hypothetical protein
MTYLRGTTLEQQEVTGGLEGITRGQSWAGPMGIAWIAAFISSATATFAPANVMRFFRNLDATDPLLSRFGWLLAATVAVLSAVMLSGGQALATSAWIKPIKFSVSFATFAWTVSLFFSALDLSYLQQKLSRYAIAGSVTLEMTCLIVQSWRSIHVGALTRVDLLAAQAASAMISVVTLVSIWLFAMFLRSSQGTLLIDKAQILAIRLSMAIFLVGNAIGGYMLARGSHTVGASDGTQGLPFLNWSSVAGDLRIAHFIALHAIQIIPLFAWLLWQMSPRPSLKYRQRTVVIVSALVTLTVSATFIQAALGRPLLSFLR